MTEKNIFCFSKSYNDENSFQQKRYRAFNKQLTEKRYDEVLKLVGNILPKEALSLSEFWKNVTADQWKQLLQIPEAADFKEGFEYISAVKLPDIEGLSGTEVSVTIKGQTYKAIIQ